MKKTLFYSLILLFFSFGFISSTDYRFIDNDSFQQGEAINYKVKYGFIPIGSAHVKMEKKIYNFNNRPCFKVNVTGRTSGVTDIYKIRNSYRSYFDTLAIVPHIFQYSAREGNFKRDQELYFKQTANKVTQKDEKGSKTYSTPPNVQDLVSGYYYLRLLDYGNYSVGQEITIPFFFDEENFTLRIRYLGKQTISTNFGKITCFKLTPVLPKNKMFSGDSGINVWVSDDKNHIPIKIEASLVVGNVTMEISEYSGLRHKMNFH